MDSILAKYKRAGIGNILTELTRLLAATKLLKLGCRGSSLVERRPEKAGVASSILAPGTTQLCKRPFPEEIYLPIGFKAQFSVLRNSVQSELAKPVRPGVRVLRELL
jgi:hypothetical protein